MDGLIQQEPPLFLFFVTGSPTGVSPILVLKFDRNRICIYIYIYTYYGTLEEML